MTSLTMIFLMSLCCVAAFLVMLIRTVGVRWVLKYATVIDVIFTVVMCIALAGTLTGVLIGILAGLVLTGALTITKWAYSQMDNARAAMVRDVTPAEDWCPGGTPEKLSK